MARRYQLVFCGSIQEKIYAQDLILCIHNFTSQILHTFSWGFENQSDIKMITDKIPFLENRVLMLSRQET